MRFRICTEEKRGRGREGARRQGARPRDAEREVSGWGRGLKSKSELPERGGAVEKGCHDGDQSASQHCSLYYFK